MNELGVIDIRGEDDVVRAHQTTRTIASQLAFSTFEQTRIATATSEMARNALAYAGSGNVTICVDDDHPALVIVVIDRGPGISDLEEILAGGRGTNRPGIGISGARRLVDTFAIESSERGTRVEMRKRLPRRSSAIDPGRVGSIRVQLAGQLADDPRQEIGRLVRDVAERDHRIIELTQELIETNRGVMALHAELENRATYQRDAIDLRNRLLSEMGHELRTPLHSMLTIAQFLLDRLDGELNVEQDKQVRIIHEISSNLADYINDLLDLARADAGKVPVHPLEFRADTLLKTLRRMMQPLASDPRVALRFDTPEAIPPLRTDETKVSQILRNLIANALKFTEQGTIDVRARLGEDDHVIFEVSDTGVGIPAEHLVEIFEEFSRIDGSAHRRVRGTGLGLPLSRRLAELLGGTLRVSSVAGEGSTFTLTIPRVYAGEASAPRPELREAVAPVEPLPGQPKVLVIDDDEGSRYVLRRWLGGRYRVDEATGGYDGLARAQASRPDAIFLDVVMPDLTGFEVLERLKASPETREIPVIVYTALTLGTNDRARLAAASALLRKSTSSRVADRSAVEEALVVAGIATRLERRD